ncbi:MAG: AAA family ATPase, partial [Syntrophomonas sp.]
GQTIMQLFHDRLKHTNVFSAEEAIIRGVSNIGSGIAGLDLLPSSLDLVSLQDYLIQIPSNGVFSQRPLTILGETIAEAINSYDFVLIDCPPNLGLITQNGLILSQYYLIPVIPDVLSTYGIPQIIQRIKLLERETGLPIEPLGLVVNKFREQGKSLYENRLRVLQGSIDKGGYRRIFSTIIPESSRAAAVMDFTAKYKNLHNKYTYATPYQQYKSLTEEVLKYVRT